MLMSRTLLALATLFGAGTVAASEIEPSAPREAHIISRDRDHFFRGSHRLYNRKAEGLIEVSYCGRPYWVRYATVAWTQLEAQQNYNVRVEFNWGKGWRPVCDNAEEEVTLKDIGVAEDPRVVMHNDGAGIRRASRFSVIRRAFSPTSGDDAARSFHGE